MSSTCSVDPDTPLRLDEAASLALPNGGMTASGLRRERDHGRLVTEMIAGKEFTTLRDIAEMRKLCRVIPKDHNLVAKASSKQRWKNCRAGVGVSSNSGSKRSTGAGKGQTAKAEAALRDYLNAKSTPRTRDRDPSESDRNHNRYLC